MKCQKCGFEIQEGMGFCSKCGTAITYTSQPEQPVQSEPSVNIFNPFAERIMSVVQDKLFLTICILMTVSCGCSVLSGSLPDIISILFTIFLWLAFANGQKGVLPTEHLKCVSGTVYANYVIANVVSGIFIVCGIIFLSSFGYASKLGEYYIYELMNKLGLSLNLVVDIAQISLAAIFLIFGFAFIFAAALMLVFNLLGMKKIHRFVKSAYQSVNSPAPYFENPVGAKNWLMFFGVCSVISSLSALNSGLLAFVASACAGVAGILGSVLIGKYFTYVQQNNIL
ncbi:MAG: zinc ribbon domain-containing protein [Clostridia bacterium]|nr:zinc ribbon domain-containing protein [Clostridia bacterium]